MDNQLQIVANKDGTLKSIVIDGDKYSMNWVESSTKEWGMPCFDAQISFNTKQPLVFDSKNGDECTYVNSAMKVTVSRKLSENKQILSEKYTFCNISGDVLCIKKGECGIFIPFNENYEESRYCQTNKCHTHIWCGGASSYVCALRMGESDLNLGLILREGSLDCYRQYNPEYSKNDRGDFELCIPPMALLPNEEYSISWDILVHKSKSDFISKLIESDNYDYIYFDNETISTNDRLNCKIYSKSFSDDCRVLIDDKDIKTNKSERYLSFSQKGLEIGEHIVKVINNGRVSIGKAYVFSTLESIIERRVHFICNHQQCLNKNSPLFGAYLIYDNREKTTFYSRYVTDHNACRERIGMGILIAKYLQIYYEEEVFESLMLYKDFVLSQFVDKDTGDVFDSIGKDSGEIRLYNAPWVCTFFCELYKLTNEKEYLDIAFRVISKFYDNGGDKFYPNAFTISEVYKCFDEAGMNNESEYIKKMALAHADHIISNGVEYPKHEVDYEQTIVAPALTFLLSAFELTFDKKYLDEAKVHLELLERFDGFAPDYRLCEIAIRHWDDYWFGKSAQFGDTFPHYWTILSGWCYKLYGKYTHDKLYLTKASNNALNNLCLFGEDGSASCAYLYPFMINNNKGEYFDDWANDQDFALYFAMKILSEE